MTEQSFQYDVLVVGAGNAACSAALAAVERNLRVGVLEKAPKRDRGGNSALTGQMRFVYNNIDDLRPLIKNISEADLRNLVDKLPHRTEAEIWADAMAVTDNQADPDMLQVHVTESLNTVHWLAGKGHDWVPTGLAGIAVDNILMMNGGGYGLQQRNFSILERAGAVFHYETAAMGLLQDKQGRVTGVRATTRQGEAAFNARSVVLACGGFEGNPEMRARYLGPGWDMIKMRGVPFNTGDGLRMALEIGAMPYGSWSTCHASPQDINIPDFVVPSAIASGGGGSFSRYVYPYSIMVNVNGERFVDEASDTRGKTYAKMGRAILSQPGGIAFQVMDARVRRMNLYTPSYSKATTAKADSLEKLAMELGINPAGLVRTVREFNGAIQPGEFVPDHLRLDGKCTAGIYPAKSNYCLSIEEPPFEAWPVRCGITFTFGGLKIDPRTCQVLHVAGWPVTGLYAAGEMIGGLFIGNYPSGSGMMAGATFGKLAGTHAALHCLNTV